jgi:hypothetical protein
MKAAGVAVALLVAVIWAVPAQVRRYPDWVQVGAAPNRYMIRVHGSGVVETPKLTPPAGANVIVQVVGGSLALDRLRWTVASSTPWLAGPEARAAVSGFLTVSPRENGAAIPTSSACALSGTARWFGAGTSYFAGETGVEHVAASDFGVGGVAIWTSSGQPFTVEVSPLLTAESPDPVVQVEHTGDYILDILARW